MSFRRISVIRVGVIRFKFFLGPVLIRTKRKGQYVLLYKSYTYSRSAKSKKGTVWKCTASKSEECEARMTTDDNLNVVASKGEHTHKPTEREVTVVTTVSGATLLILNGYSFTNPAPMTGGERWFCSGRIRWKCNVCLCVNDDYELVCISNEHSHEPPREGVVDTDVDRVGETHRYCVCDHGVATRNISSYAQLDLITSMVTA
ncbi:unnamed protein product [Spodoptera littoralis]|uniref:FLYWCH-type domain-containing protein n=1 Tax=Spodoptera littoralis TaxID=7109 RepID=A0A9P0HXE8_SPOLI|nr:unnamed protein product [Spodoptera littoralis]CAH1635560.1 unnamed protein product [Spodoptera littoralis]